MLARAPGRTFMLASAAMLHAATRSGSVRLAGARLSTWNGFPILES